MQPLRWGEEAKEARRHAGECAAEFGHGQVHGGHVLLALARGRGAAARAFAERGIEPQALERAVRETYEGPPLVVGDEVDPFCAAAKALWETAEELAEADALLEVLPAHLFLAATEDPCAHGYRTLRALSLEVGRVRDEVAARVRDELNGVI